MVALAAQLKANPISSTIGMNMSHSHEYAAASEIIPFHDPVLSREAVEHLEVRSGLVYVDATAGEGGHSLALLQASAPSGSVLGIDKDPRSLARAQKRLSSFGTRFQAVAGNYADIQKIARDAQYPATDGVLIDLGLSSWQLEASGAGFSFQRDEPLDMRFNPNQTDPNAADLVNLASEDELSRILLNLGEEPKARIIARIIVQSRSEGYIETTNQLSAILRRVPGLGRGKRTHPATRTFQALRIAVNDELANLQLGIQGAISLLKTGGRLAIISYHSLEDRIVKQTFVQESSDCICDKTIPVCTCGHKAITRIVNRRIVTPSSPEVKSNPRSRSARMRVVEKL